MSKSTVPVPPYVREGKGSNEFSNKGLLLTWVASSSIAALLLPLSAMGILVVAVLLMLPVFVMFNYVYAHRMEASASAKKVQDYLDIKDPSLSMYCDGNKIPMETWFEAYFDGKLDVKGDMLEILERRHDWGKFVFTWNQAKFFVTQWLPETLWHSRQQDQDQVRDHYDRGDDFYEAFCKSDQVQLMLVGSMMVYTSGIIQDKSRFESLEELQQNKMDLVASKINLKAGDTLLDIGCGWGTLSVHAAKKGARVTGVTLGRNQHEWGTRKAAEANVSELVKILCMDYRDIPKTETFDKITCLEMSEHVGILRYQTFLKQVKRLLKDDGIFFLQIAGLRRAWQYEDLTWGLFMAKYVFPGADASPPLNWVVEQLERAGFEVAHIDTMGVHYSATIYRWYINWMANKETIIAKYGQVWFRRWEVFLAWSTIIARQGSATCYQITCHKNRNAFDRQQFIGDRLKGY